MEVKTLKEEIKIIREPRRTSYGNVRHKLLDLIDVENAIVTGDAMNCQKKIVEQIAEKKADYVIGLKSNQATLLEDVSLYFQDFREEIPSYTTLDKGHGRVERREYRLLTDISWLEQRDAWKNLRSVGAVRTVVEENGETREDMRYFITSLTDLHEFSDAVRKHWSIENQLHWCLDVLFREDASCMKKDNSPLNMNVLRKCALSLLNRAQSARMSKKDSCLRLLLIPLSCSMFCSREKVNAVAVGVHWQKECSVHW